MYYLFIFYQVQLPKTSGRELPERSGSPKQLLDEETSSLLMIENGNMNKEKWKLDMVNKHSNGQTNRRHTEHRLSALSLGYIPTEHPTSYES